MCPLSAHPYSARSAIEVIVVVVVVVVVLVVVVLLLLEYSIF